MLLRFVAVWGGSFFFNSIALRDLTALTVVESRIDLAAVILLSVLRLRQERRLRAKSVWIAFFHDWASEKRHPVFPERLGPAAYRLDP